MPDLLSQLSSVTGFTASLAEGVGPLPAALGGAAAGLALVGLPAAWLWARSARLRGERRLAAEKQRAAKVVAEQRQVIQKQIDEYHARVRRQYNTLHNDYNALRNHTRRVEQERGRLVRGVKALQQQISEVQALDSRPWERPVGKVGAPVPAFAGAEQRHTRFITVMNLKGGVGKTTLTANLGVGLARRGYRVLMVDLDFQGSLTGLCMGHDEFRALRQTGRTASRLLDNAGDGWTSRVMDLAAPVRGLPEVVVVKGGRLGGEPRPVVCDVVGASEELAEAEHRAQARWLLNVGAGAKADVHDARFLFRRCFHLPEVFAKYDVVLFDCPPRLTTASVNALGCSDFVLVPLLLDQLSVEALPRTLAWLERLPEVSRRTRLLGVVGNRARYYRGELRKRQRDLFERLPDTIRAAGYAWGGEPFRGLIKDSSEVEEAVNDGRIAAAADKGVALFKDVIDKVEASAWKPLPARLTGEAGVEVAPRDVEPMNVEAV